MVHIYMNMKVYYCKSWLVGCRVFALDSPFLEAQLIDLERAVRCTRIIVWVSRIRTWDARAAVIGL
jgi:hypothetical protein